MVLQNCYKILKELSAVEERIKLLEDFLDSNSIEIEREELLKSLFNSYVE